MLRVFRHEALDDIYLVDESLVEIFIREFRTLAPTLTRSIEDAQTGGDFKKAELHSHALKSSAKLLGFDKMAEVCLKIENSAQAQVFKTDLVSQLPALYGEALSAIELYLESRKAS